MTYYPIIIIPDRHQKLKAAMPKVPKFQEIQPRSPKAPNPLNISMNNLDAWGGVPSSKEI